MNRKQFLSTGALATLAVCLGACKDDEGGNTAAPSGVNFTVDLNDAANVSLKSTGGSVTKNGVVVIALTSSTYAAFQANCPHAGTTINYNGTGFRCPNHGATFDSNGNRTSGPTNSNLKRYTVAVAGNIITITG